MKKLVLFGAGKIGRSFIGQLFSASGYEVVFVDINEAVIRELNSRHRYKVVIKSESEDTMWVENVRGVLGTDINSVIGELSTADVAAVSVGQKGLMHIIPVIAKALELRSVTVRKPLDIIIAENMRNADQFIREELKKHLPKTFPLEAMVGLVETSIGKMVPIMPREEEEKDLLQVFAEPYNTLIVDKKGFLNPLPEVKGMDPKENMKAWVDRKSFIHNFGHAAVSYVGYLYNPQFIYLYEALAISDIKLFARSAMLEAGAILMKKYPGEFTPEHITSHIDDLLKRFENKALGDTIYRVGCDLQRKLSRNDRIVGVLMEGLAFSMPVDHILFTLVCGFKFRAKNEQNTLFPADADFVRMLDDKGFEKVLTDLCIIPSDYSDIHSKAKDWYNNLNNTFKEQIKFLLLGKY